MGQFSFGNDAPEGPSEGSAKNQLAASAKSRHASRSLPELTGDGATDQALVELAEVLAEIARDVARRLVEEHESQSSEGTQDDRRS